MIPNLLEESTSDVVPRNLEAIVTSLTRQSRGRVTSSDLLVALVYVMMVETGFTPLDLNSRINISGSFSKFGHEFSIQKLRAIQSLPVDWRNDTRSIYRIYFILNPFVDYSCRLIAIKAGNSLLINLLLTNEKLALTMSTSICFIPSKYVTNLTTTKIPNMFSNLKELSQNFKNVMSSPVRSAVLTSEGIINASLEGIPDEVKSQIFQYLDPPDLMALSETCKEMNNLVNDQTLWRFLLERDFGKRKRTMKILEQTVEEQIERKVDWREEYVRCTLDPELELIVLHMSDESSDSDSSNDEFFEALTWSDLTLNDYDNQTSPVTDTSNRL